MLELPLHLLVLALVLTQQCQIVELLGHIRVVRAEHFLSNFQGALAKWLRILRCACISLTISKPKPNLVFPPLPIEDSKIVKCGSHSRVESVQECCAMP